MDPTRKPANADQPAAAIDDSPPPSPGEGCGDETHLPLSNTNIHVTDTPIYWTRHGRTTSYHSIGGSRGAPILLEDHSEESNVLSQGCWAKSATIDEYVLVTGPTGIGAYVVWHCTVETLKGGDMVIRKR